MPRRERKKRNLRGIGGWLILPMLAFMFEIVKIFQNLVKYPENTSLMIFGIIMIIVYTVTLVFIFKEKKQTPVLAIIALWAGFAYVLLTTYSATGSVVVDGTWTIIWTWYFNVSKRVKNTFVK